MCPFLFTTIAKICGLIDITHVVSRKIENGIGKLKFSFVVVDDF